MDTFLLTLTGAFVLICTLGNFDWFMNHNKTRFLISIIGETGTKLFYLIIGITSLLYGIITIIKESIK